MTPQGTVHQDVMSAVRRAAGLELGEKAEEVFAFLDLSKRVPMMQALTVWTRLAELDDDGTLGARIGTHQLGDDRGVLHALMSAAGAQETMGRAMRVLSRYYALVSSSAELSIELHGEGAAREFQIRSLNGAGYRNPVVVQSTLYVLLSGIREISKPPAPLLRVTFAAPIQKELCQRLKPFYGAPVVGGTGIDSLVFAGSFAEQQLPKELRVGKSVERAAAEIPFLDDEFEKNGSALQESVVKEIQMLLPKAPTLEAIADRLALTTRSLQRRLKEEGVQFRELCVQTRVQIARGYLSVGGSVDEVSHLVGYADATAFTHTYRRVMGHPPVQDRAFVPKTLAQEHASELPKIDS